MLVDLFENFNIDDTMIHDRGRPHHVGNSDRMVDCSFVGNFHENDYYHYSDCNGYPCCLDDSYFGSNCFRGRRHVDVDWISMVRRSVVAYLVWLKT